jgi:hypothetical protein
MRHYDLPLPPDVKAALAAIHAGVVCVGVTGRATGLEGFFGCELELASGQVISICADQNDLEFKFEVFPIKAVFASAFEAEERQQTLICAPVEVVLLKTQDWLDPGIPCEGAIGQNPIMQCQGLPGEALQSTGRPKSCAFYAPVMSNVSRQTGVPGGSLSEERSFQCVICSTRVRGTPLARKSSSARLCQMI